MNVAMPSLAAAPTGALTGPVKQPHDDADPQPTTSGHSFADALSSAKADRRDDDARQRAKTANSGQPSAAHLLLSYGVPVQLAVPSNPAPAADEGSTPLDRLGAGGTSALSSGVVSPNGGQFSIANAPATLPHATSSAGSASPRAPLAASGVATHAETASGSPLVARATANSAQAPSSDATLEPAAEETNDLPTSADTSSAGAGVAADAAPADVLAATARAADLLASVAAMPGATVASGAGAFGKANFGAISDVGPATASDVAGTAGARAKPAAPEAGAAASTNARGVAADGASAKPGAANGASAKATVVAADGAVAKDSAGVPADARASVDRGLDHVATTAAEHSAPNPDGGHQSSAGGDAPDPNASAPAVALGTNTVAASAAGVLAGKRGVKKPAPFGVDAAASTDATATAGTAPVGSAQAAPVKTLTDPKPGATAEAVPQTSAEDAVTAAEAVGHKRVLASGEAHGQITVPELGRFEVHASTNDAQHVAVRVHADDAHARAVLTSQQGELRAHLRADVPNASVTIDSRNSSGNSGQNAGDSQGGDAESDDVHAAAAAPKAVAARPARFVL